jgi:hypothetical protein
MTSRSLDVQLDRKEASSLPSSSSSPHRLDSKSSPPIQPSSPEPQEHKNMNRAISSKLVSSQQHSDASLQSSFHEVKLDSSVPASSFLPNANWPVPIISIDQISSQLTKENKMGSGAFKTAYSVVLKGKKFAFFTILDPNSEQAQKLLNSEVEHFP